MFSQANFVSVIHGADLNKAMNSCSTIQRLEEAIDKIQVRACVVCVCACVCVCVC